MIKNQIRTLIVDDEPFSREELKFLLQSIPFIHVVGEADCGQSALIKAVQLKPDLIFLDIELPNINGLDVARSLKELKHEPHIIFATAYPNFAVESYRLHAHDYLLKPYEEEQLYDTLSRLYEQNSSTAEITSVGKLPIEHQDEIIYIQPNDIRYAYSLERQTFIVTAKETYATNYLLKDLETKLFPFSFYRIHRSYLVNIHYVQKLSPWFNSSYQLYLHGCTEPLAVSRNYVKGLRELLEL